MLNRRSLLTVPAHGARVAAPLEPAATFGTGRAAAPCHRPMWPSVVRLALAIPILALAVTRPASGEVTAEGVRKAIDSGTKFLKRKQNPDGSWGQNSLYPGGISALVMLALLESGTRPDDPVTDRGLIHLRSIKPEKTYVVSLQTMVYCLARPKEDMAKIKENVAWLERMQIKSGANTGMWDYAAPLGGRGDNSNTQFALLGLREAAEIGVEVNPEVWKRSRHHFVSTQGGDGGWDYPQNGATGSMTVAGIASLIITGLRLHEGEETIVDGEIRNCGTWRQNDAIVRGLGWLAGKFSVRSNPPSGDWNFYYLYGLERAARLSGQRFVGQHDWYREGADLLVSAQKLGGLWQGGGPVESNELIATSFALLFLAKGRAPVLINKLRHDSSDPQRPEDWNNDRNDVRHLTEHVARHWERRMTWQVVDAKTAKVEDLLQAPVLFLNGHEAPVFDATEKERLRDYINQGGFIFAEACCSREGFNAGIRRLFRELFPDDELKVLSPDHPIWKADYPLTADESLEGIDIGCRTSVVYSRHDLSCYWEQKDNPESVRATRLGTNVLAYATGKELLPDKLDARKVVRLGAGGPPSRATLQIGKLKHGGDWKVAPMAVPNLMASLRDNLAMDVAIEPRELSPLDENLYTIRILYMHGRSHFDYTDEQIGRIREYLQRGGTLFADACCGREPFDVSFRSLARRLLPDAELKQIPIDHEIFGTPQENGQPIGYDLHTVQYTKAMPRREGEPFLEGIELNGRWAVIYSKYDIGCALERHQGSDCRGYTHESAVKIATNVILYALLP